MNSTWTYTGDFNAPELHKALNDLAAKHAKLTAPLLQRKLKIGFETASRLLTKYNLRKDFERDMMERVD